MARWLVSPLFITIASLFNVARAQTNVPVTINQDAISCMQTCINQTVTQSTGQVFQQGFDFHPLICSNSTLVNQVISCLSGACWTSALDTAKTRFFDFCASSLLHPVQNGTNSNTTSSSILNNTSTSNGTFKPTSKQLSTKLLITLSIFGFFLCILVPYLVYVVMREMSVTKSRAVFEDETTRTRAHNGSTTEMGIDEKKKGEELEEDDDDDVKREKIVRTVCRSGDP